MEGMTMTRRQLVGAAVIVEAGMALLAVLLGWWFGLPMGEWFRWSLAGAAWGLGGALALLAVLELCKRFPVGPIGKLMRLVDEVVRPMFGECRVVDLLLISVLAGVGEELLFRGVIQGGLAAWWVPMMGEFAGVGAALVVASLLFGLAHCISREYVVFAAVMGLAMGGLAICSGGLLAPIVAHAVYDFGALLLLTSGRKGTPACHGEV